jgi:subtilisin family serine protease
VAGVVGPELQRAMAQRGSHADTAVLVRFASPPALQDWAVTDRRLRDNRLLQALRQATVAQRAALDPWLQAHQATRLQELWIIHGLAATLPATAVAQLAQQPGVARVDLDAFMQGARSQRLPPARAAMAPAPATSALSNPPTPPFQPPAPRADTAPWNLRAVHAPEIWAMGYTGQGLVLASMDSGVDAAHPSLQRQWRAGSNSWFDPHGEQATPTDTSGHGTQTLGLMLGQAGLGVAPAARWIAVRLYNGQGRASMSDIHRSFQWLLDPDGDPATLDAPDVVNASWSLTGRTTGACVLEFAQDIQALKAAGIAVVFAAGNDGPQPRSSSSPGNNPGVLSVGALDSQLQIARQTSRGPSACSGAVFPSLLAPGVQVRTADLSHGGQPSTTVMSGSSMAAPHVAGVLALLMGAFPGASVAELEAALRGSNLETDPRDPTLAESVQTEPVMLDARAAFARLQRATPSRLTGN